MPGMKIAKLEASQFMRVEVAELDFPLAGATDIGAANGGGKTSLRTLLEAFFRGKDGVPDVPVRVGAKKSVNKLTLDDEGRTVTIEMEVRPDRGLTTVVRQDGGPPVAAPITLLKSMVNGFSFDPFALMALRGREQRNKFLECLGVQFDDLEAKAESIRAERKDAGRDVAGREKQIASMPEHVGVPAKEIDLNRVAAEMQEAIAHNTKRDKFVAAVESWEMEVEGAETDIETLEQQLVAARKRLLEGKAGLEKAKADAAKIKEIDIKPIGERLRLGNDTNAKVRANHARAALVAQFQADHDRYRELGEQLEAIEKQKMDRLAAAKCPVKGLTFTEDAVLLDGLPFTQDMESHQMLVCVELAAALNPTLRTIVIDGAERILPPLWAELNAWAVDHDYQVFGFKATEGHECMFTLEDGKVKP